MAYGGEEPIYDDDGFDEAGFDREGYSKDEYDSDGFNPAGFDSYGYNRIGLDQDGLDHDGIHYLSSKTSYPEKGIFIGGYEGAGHIWDEIEEYFPYIDPKGKRKINIGKNQKGEITVGLLHDTSRPFKLFTKLDDDEFIVNKSIPASIKRILGIPEDEPKRKYNLKKNEKENEEIEKFKKEIERMKIERKRNLESFLEYVKKRKEGSEDITRKIEKLRLRQTGDGEGGGVEIIRLNDEINRLNDYIRVKKKYVIETNEKIKKWGELKNIEIEDLKKKGKITEKENEEMKRLGRMALEEWEKEFDKLKNDNKLMKRYISELKKKVIKMKL